MVETVLADTFLFFLHSLKALLCLDISWVYHPEPGRAWHFIVYSSYGTTSWVLLSSTTYDAFNFVVRLVDSKKANSTKAEM